MPVSTFILDNPHNVPRVSEPIASQTGGTESLGFEWKCLTDGRSAGVQQLTILCGAKMIDIIPTRGMGIWHAQNEDVPFGWDSPVVDPIHPMWVPISEPGGLGWLDGFGEVMVRCGLGSNGAPEFSETGQLIWPLHGRIANLPASNVVVEIDEDKGEIVATGTVHESRFHFYRWQLESKITLRIDSPEIEIVDRVTNLSDRTCSFQMLYHNNFGTPVLGAGSTIHAPAKRVVPRNDHAASGVANWNILSGPDPKYAEEVFFLDLAGDEDGNSLVMITNEDESIGASIRYSQENLPCFIVWKNTVGLADGYVCGLEPATNFPNTRSFEEQHGRVVQVAPGQSVDLKYSIGMLVGQEEVQSAIAEIASLSPGDPELLAKPLGDWAEA